MPPVSFIANVKPSNVMVTENGVDSGGSIAAFEVVVPGGQRLTAPAHSHDHYEETIYGIDGVLAWTVDGRQIELLVSDGNESSLNFERVIFRFEILNASEIRLDRHQRCRELFNSGAFRGVAFHRGGPGSAIIPTASSGPVPRDLAPQFQ